ncbi:MAG: hypothetical protein ACTHKL_01685 [Streptosporangiaceae bacterium]
MASRRAKIKPTRAGRLAQAIWERLEGAIERRWSERLGADLVAELRAALVDAIGQPDRNLPLYLPMVRYADGMRTAVVSPTNEQLSTAKAAGDPADLGLSVLLSRALLLVTLDYERESPLSLPISADLLPAIGTGGVRFRDLPLRAGVSKEAVSAAAGFLQRAGFAVKAADATRGQAITLTDRGIAALHAHEALLGAAEERWVDRCGAEQIARLHGCVRQLAEQRTSEGQPALSLGLRPYPEGWRAQRRYKAQTDAVIADPWTALPPHPMVLHRGGTRTVPDTRVRKKTLTAHSCSIL